MSGDVLVALRQLMPRLRPAEQRVARTVLDDPAIVVGSTITELAIACDTSPTTVSRFCTAAGFSGYPEFRLAMASATSRDRTERARFSVSDGDIDPADSVEEVVLKVAYQETRAIEQTAHDLDLAALDAVVDAVVGATRIDIYGVGSSGLTGQDLQQKLHRVGLITYCWIDPHLALTSAALLTPGSVAIGISHSGLTIETNHVLEVARGAGATTVAFTNFPDSPLASAAALVLATSARESRYRSGAMSSRIAQLALVDFLFVRIAQRMYDHLGDSLQRTYEAVQSHRLGYDRREERP